MVMVPLLPPVDKPVPMDSAPDTPPDWDRPVPIKMLPLLPFDDVPVLSTRNPLTPLLPALAVLNSSAPLLETEL